MLLGDVGEVQKVGKGARHRQCLGRRAVGEKPRHLVEVTLREGTSALHQIEELLSLLRPECLAQEVAEEPDVVA